MIAGASVRSERLSKHYGTVRAVHDVTFTVEAGEFVTLLGPSGSGKTTTLMMIAGFEVPTDGDILIDGRSVAEAPPRDRNIGMIFQNYALFPHMSVYQNVGFPLRMRGQDEATIRAKVRHALDTVGLSGFDGRYPRQLSGGQQQRVAFARAIVFDAPVLLMDEPLGALDKQLRQRLQIEVKRIQRDLGVTVIYVTHDQEEALVMSDKIILMNEARIEQMGSPNDLYDRPVNRFVASFLGESNVISGELGEGAQGGVTLRIGDETVLAHNTGALPDRAAATLIVRPEKIILADPGTAPNGLNSLRGLIGDAIFVGDHQRVTVTLATGETIVVKLPQHHGRRRVAAGEPVAVTWHPADARLLDAD